jgi:Holliday junction resolvasome RuvABC ATP-dependent DNA helicase subunit
MEFFSRLRVARGKFCTLLDRSARTQSQRVMYRQEGAAEVGARARGTPRIANRLLQRVRDFAQVNAAPVVTREIALGALELLQIDACRFDKLDSS